ncbi:MAG TPA: hypothetical protein VNH53_08975 [Sphingomicrobium sp.]|jgi:hypothetical protein|nr:hypothetical protein [Sphingomicrobium sp.]
MSDEHKLTNQDAITCGAQLVDAIEQIRARHQWSDGDLLAVVTAAYTDIITRRLGPMPAIEFLRDHADCLEGDLLSPRN